MPAWCEQAVAGDERYLAVMVDAPSYGVRVIYAAPRAAWRSNARRRNAPAGLRARNRRRSPPRWHDLVAGEPPHQRDAIAAVGRKLAALLLARELALAEINPLFVSARPAAWPAMPRW